MSERLPRSPELVDRNASALLVIDVQEKLISHIAEHPRVVWNIRRLLDGAELMNVPLRGTVQNPEKLGGFVEPLASRIPEPAGKMCFSCGECGELFAELSAAGIHQLVVAGIESHVCVLQTVMDALAAGFGVFVVADAVGSRSPVDREFALRRMDSAGANLITTESVLFEWCERAGTDEFRQLSRLVREQLEES